MHCGSCCRYLLIRTQGLRVRICGSHEKARKEQYTLDALLRLVHSHVHPHMLVHTHFLRIYPLIKNNKTNKHRAYLLQIRQYSLIAQIKENIFIFQQIHYLRTAKKYNLHNETLTISLLRKDYLVCLSQGRSKLKRFEGLLIFHLMMLSARQAFWKRRL